MDLDRIHNSVEWSKRKLHKSCSERVDSVRQFVGSHYSENGSDKTVPTNMLELAVTIYLRLLAAHEPKCVVSAEDFTLKPFSKNFEIVLNQIPREINLIETIRRTVMEAMFSIGVVKVGIASVSDNPKIGDEPFVSVVQIDDYFVDMSARSWDEVQFEGNEYWMTVEDIKERFGKDIKPDEYNGTSSQGEMQASSVGVCESNEPLFEKVLVRDVYVYRTNEIITYAVNSKEVLRDAAWDGPEGSPYIKLWFEGVPGNLMPLPPISVWKDLHTLGNQLFRKLANQAVNKKSVVMFAGGSDEDVNRFKIAKDGEAIRYNGARPEEQSVGGVDNGNLAYFLNVWDRFSMICGNLDSLGGLSPQSNTATQDKLVGEAASARIQDMSDKVVEFAKKIFRRLAWYVWTDPVRERNYVRTYTKSISRKLQWTPETRDGDFLDYNFEIAVFSMQDDSPATRVQKFSQVFQTFVLPMVQMLAEQGAQIDMAFLMDYLARNTNLPEIKDLVKFSNEPPVMRESAALPQPQYVSTKSPFSHRTYERVSRSTSTRQGRDAAMMQTLMGANVQGSEMAKLAGGAG